MHGKDTLAYYWQDSSKFTNNVWEYWIRYDYQFDTFNNLLTKIYLNYNTSGTYSIENHINDSFMYNASQQIVRHVNYSYSINYSPHFFLNKIDSFFYNSNGLLSDHRMYNGNYTANWVDYFYVYDGDNRLTHLWSLDHANKYIYRDDRYYYDTLFLSVNQEERTNAICKVYPNPSGSQVNFSFISPGQSTASLQIFNLSGKSVYSKTTIKTTGGENIISIDFQKESLPDGVYLYDLQIGKATEHGKIIINR